MILICNNGCINLNDIESIQITENNEIVIYTKNREYILLADCEDDIKSYYKLDPSKFSKELLIMLTDYATTYGDDKISIDELISDVVDNLQHDEYVDHVRSQPVEITWTEVDDK